MAVGRVRRRDGIGGGKPQFGIACVFSLRSQAEIAHLPLIAQLVTK